VGLINDSGCWDGAALPVPAAAQSPEGFALNFSGRLGLRKHCHEKGYYPADNGPAEQQVNNDYGEIIGCVAFAGNQAGEQINGGGDSN
jgi:hypothetical protein